MRDCLRGWKRDWEEERLVREWKIGNKDGRWVGGIGGWLEGWTLGWENERLVRRMADWMDEWKIEQKDWRFFRRMRDWLGGLEIG